MNNLAEIMDKESLTPAKLSRLSGVRANTIRRIMKDKNAVPYFQTALKLSKVLGYSVAQIRGEKEI